jgi:uncharacterized membrane protein YphA (DoxX/SURF4 family)
MNVFLWIAAGMLAAVLLAAGASKLTKSRADLAASGQGWAEDFSPGTVKAIGVLEVLAAIGLVLPALLGIAPILVPLAATGVVLLMIGAAVTHARRREYKNIGVNAILAALALIIAITRFGSFSF